MNSTLRAGVAGCFVCLALLAPELGTSQAAPLFNGHDLTGWKPVGGKKEIQWKYGKAALDAEQTKFLKVAGEGTELVSPHPGVNLLSEASYGDCKLEFEFMVSNNSNSGVKLEGIYEIQIFDSFGKKNPGITDCGAVYDEKPPRVNASKPAGEWQKMEIEFHAPRFDAAGNKTANAKFIKVVLNGEAVQENEEIAHGTNVGRNAKEHPTGPIYVQGDHGPVAFRNFTITPLNP